MRWRLLWVVAVISATSATRAQAEGDPIRARLIEVLTNDSSVKLRVLAAKRLGELAPTPEDRPVVDALVHGLEDSSSMVRVMSARSLADRRSRVAQVRLESLASNDKDPLVRREARAAAERISAALAPRRSDRRRTVELGTVDLSNGLELQENDTVALKASLRDLVETQIEPHLPAMFPREDAGYRLNVRVKRDRVKVDHGTEIRCEVSVLVLELPTSHLRHAAQARASGTSRARGPRQLSDLEAKVAREATNVAVREALASLMEN